MMKYPMICVFDPWIGETYREMTPAEYEEKLDWFRNYIKENENDTARRAQEYVSYLKRWLGDGPCDGLPNYKLRKGFHHLPMSYNVYFN